VLSRTPVLIVPLLIVASACSGPRQRAADFVRRGDEQVAAGRNSAAILEYRNAVRRDPKLAEAHRKLGDVYLEEGKLEEAYHAFANATSVDPADVHSRVEAGRLLYGAGRFTEALVRAEQALERDDQSVDAQVLAGRALTSLRRFDEAIAQLDAAVAHDHAPPAYAALADAKLAAGDRSGAEAALRAGVLAAPASADARIALAGYLVSAARYPEAEREFLAAVHASPTSEMANRAAASFYLSRHQDAAAEPFLKTAAGLPRQKLNSTLALADYYSAAKRYQDARDVLAPLAAGSDPGPAKVRLAAIELESGSAQTARRLLDDLIKRRPTAQALALNAQLLLREGKSDEALAAARHAVDLDPQIAIAHYVIGSIELDRGHLVDAESAFREVLRQDRLTKDASLQLARTLLAAGRPREAIDLADAAGRSVDARLTLARALAADRQEARARSELLQLSADNPASPQPSIELGQLELRSGALPQARALAEHALTLAPESADALLLAARVAVASNDPKAAEPYLTHAVAVAPTLFDARAMLAQIYAGRRDFDRARATLEQAATRQPDSAPPRTALGIVLEAAGRPSDARARYEQALALDPGDPVASNNLARIYAADDAMVSPALQLALNAAARMPDDAEVRDTLGWVAFRAGRLTLAASELERAVSLNPNEPAYRTHLQEVRRALEDAAAAAKKRG
jgi:tetratricopeptide (TPR) repeat protein